MTTVKVKIQLTQKDLKRLVMEEIQKQVGDFGIMDDDVKIETKSTQNYKSEWEDGAAFRATIEIDR